jgi:hypothetical protein
MVTPPEVPMPGIEGGGKAKAMPSGLPRAASADCLDVLKLLLLALATSHGLSATKKKPALVLCTWVSSEKFVTAITPSRRES